MSNDARLDPNNKPDLGVENKSYQPLDVREYKDGSVVHPYEVTGSNKESLMELAMLLTRTSKEETRPHF